MIVAIIGCGAIGEAVAAYLAEHDRVRIGAAIVEPHMGSKAGEVFGDDVEIVHCIEDVSTRIDLVVDCAGHSALRLFGNEGEPAWTRPRSLHPLGNLQFSS